MANLWDYISGNVSVDSNSPMVDKALYSFTSGPRVAYNGAQSVYDSFKRGMSNPNIEDAFNVAASAMTGSLPFAPKGAGTLGTVKLPSATSYSKVLSSMAKAKISKGEDLASVWKQTGYHPLGNTLVGEISDAGTGFNLAEIAKLKSIAEARMHDVSAPLGRIVNHPELFKNYPWLKDEYVVMRSHAENEGSYNPKSMLINLSAKDKDMYNTFLHELDHKLTIPEIFKPQTPKTYEQYLNLPYEQSARMRELRFKNNDYTSLPKLK